MEKEEEKKKSNINLIITIVVLCIIVVVLGVLLFLNMGTKNNSSSKKDTQTSDTKKDDMEKEETEESSSQEEISDDIKLLLYSKLNVLFISREEDTYNESTTYGGYGFNYKVLKDSLSNYDKQQIILESLKFDSIDNSRWEEVSKVKKAIDKDSEHIQNAKDEYGYLPFDTVNQSYKKLFGKTLSNPEEEIGKCPKFVYSEETDEFYRFRTACGGSSSGSVLTYISKFERKDDSIIMYLSVGYINAKSLETETGYDVYGDIEFDSDRQTSTGTKNLITSVDNNNYVINQDNYEQFSQYKLTFKKGQDNYYFSGSKQVK